MGGGPGDDEVEGRPFEVFNRLCGGSSGGTSRAGDVAMASSSEAKT